MTNLNYTLERIKGKHLGLNDRIEIEKALYHPEKSKRQIAKEIGVSPQTIINEIKRGTINQVKIVNGKLKHFSVYSATAAQEKYYKSRRNNSNASKIEKCKDLINYCIQKIKQDKNSVDEVVGRTKLLNLFNKEEMVSTKTIYNYIEDGIIEVKNIDLPEKVRRKPKKEKKDTRSVILGKSIIQRPESVETREEFGHFEADTVVGKKGKENVLLVLTERKTIYQINIMIDSKTTDSVEYGITKIISNYDKDVFKSITVDNGTEFATL